MYVKRAVRKRGDKSYTYLSLVEAVQVDGKNRQWELLRLGEVGDLERSGQLDRIVAILSTFASSSYVSIDALSANAAPSFGAVAAVAAYFPRTRLRDHFCSIGTA